MPSDHRIITKAVPLYAIDLDANEGVVKGFPAVMGNWDDDGEMVPMGAFAKTISERADRVPMGLDHEYPLGTTIKLEEVTRDALPARMKAEYPDATGALYAEGRVSMMPDNLEWLEAERRRIEHGKPSGMSFVARVLSTRKGKAPGGREGLVLAELALNEWGPTTGLVHRNRAAGVLAVKAGESDTWADDETPIAQLLHLAGQMAEFEAAVKGGRVLSARNLTALDAAIRELQRIRAAAMGTEDAGDMGEEPPPEPVQKARPALLIAEAQLRISGLRAELLGV